MNLNKIFLIFVLLGAISSKERIASLVKKGNKAYEAKDYSKALSIYKTAIKLDKKNKIVNYNVGSAYFMLEEYDAAFEHYIKCDKDDYALLMLGNIMKKRGEKNSDIMLKMQFYTKALLYYKQAIMINEKNYKAKFCYEAMGRIVFKFNERYGKAEIDNLNSIVEDFGYGNKKKELTDIDESIFKHNDNEKGDDKQLDYSLKKLLDELDKSENEDLLNNWKLKINKSKVNKNEKNW